MSIERDEPQFELVEDEDGGRADDRTDAERAADEEDDGDA